MDEAYIGTIMLFAGNFAPRGWRICDGSILPIAQHQALFAVIGPTYGGDGRSTFALPDLRGRVPVGFGSGPGLSPVALGAHGGSESVSLQQHQLPPHTHMVDFAPVTGGSAEGGLIVATPAQTAVGSAMHLPAGATGGGQPHENRQPYLGLNYIIAIEGLFPVRE